VSVLNQQKQKGISSDARSQGLPSSFVFHSVHATDCVVVLRLCFCLSRLCNIRVTGAYLNRVGKEDRKRCHLSDTSKTPSSHDLGATGVGV
jgi:hypothetical protein